MISTSKDSDKRLLFRLKTERKFLYNDVLGKKKAIKCTAIGYLYLEIKEGKGKSFPGQSKMVDRHGN